jgi:hypothetical protein
MSETTEASPAPLSLRRRITLPQYGWRPKLRWFAAEIVVVVAGVLIALGPPQSHTPGANDRTAQPLPAHPISLSLSRGQCSQHATSSQISAT